MATTDRNGSNDGTTAELQRTIALTPEQARYVGGLLFEQTAAAVDAAGASLGESERREEFPAIRRALDDGEAALRPIEYEAPVNRVTLDAPPRAGSRTSPRG